MSTMRGKGKRRGRREDKEGGIAILRIPILTLFLAEME